MRNFKGKIAFISGGGTGAGLGQAKTFAKAGMKVAIASRRLDVLHNAANEIIEYSGCSPKDVLVISADLTNREEYAKAADTVEKVFGGPPHLLIQTAGVNTLGPAEAATFDDFDWIMSVCLNHVINGLVTFVPRMLKAYGGENGVPKEEFHIATTSSLAAFIPCGTAAPYAAAKAAVNNLMFSYYESLAEYGCGVTVLCPGGINSRIYECELNRPEKFKNSGNYVSEGVINTMKSLYETGIDPLDLAAILKEAIENGRVVALPFNTYDECYAKMRKDHEDIEDYLLTEEERNKKRLINGVEDHSVEVPENGEPMNMAREAHGFILKDRCI